MKDKKKLLRALGEAMAAAPRAAGNDPEKQAGYVLHRLEEAGFQVGQFEVCPVCGASVELLKGHEAWHERARTHGASASA